MEEEEESSGTSILNMPSNETCIPSPNNDSFLGPAGAGADAADLFMAPTDSSDDDEHCQINHEEYVPTRLSLVGQMPSSNSQDTRLRRRKWRVFIDSTVHCDDGVKAKVNSMHREKAQKEVVEDGIAPIPSEHPLKIAWDIVTIILSLTVGPYTTHAAIRDRCFLHHFENYKNSEDVGFGDYIDDEYGAKYAHGNCKAFTSSEEMNFDNVMRVRYIPTFELFGTKFNLLAIFIEVWFFVDIVLNFYTQHRMARGEILKHSKDVKTRYVKTWFAIDFLSLLPWERVLIQPIIEKQNRRNWFTKTFMRSRAVVRITPKVLRNLRKTNVLFFGRVARKTGWGVAGLVRKMIRYMPKYLLFYRNMKGALAIRLLRQVHWFRKLFKLFTSSAPSAIDVKHFQADVCEPIEEIEVILIEDDERTQQQNSNDEYVEYDSENEDVVVMTAPPPPPSSPYEFLSVNSANTEKILTGGLVRHPSLGSQVFTHTGNGDFVPASPVMRRRPMDKRKTAYEI